MQAQAMTVAINRRPHSSSLRVLMPLSPGCSGRIRILRSSPAQEQDAGNQKNLHEQNRETSPEHGPRPHPRLDFDRNRSVHLHPLGDGNSCGNTEDRDQGEVPGGSCAEICPNGKDSTRDPEYQWQVHANDHLSSSCRTWSVRLKCPGGARVATTLREGLLVCHLCQHDIAIHNTCLSAFQADAALCELVALKLKRLLAV